MLNLSLQAYVVCSTGVDVKVSCYAKHELYYASREAHALRGSVLQNAELRALARRQV